MRGKKLFFAILAALSVAFMVSPNIARAESRVSVHGVQETTDSSGHALTMAVMVTTNTVDPVRFIRSRMLEARYCLMSGGSNARNEALSKVRLVRIDRYSKEEMPKMGWIAKAVATAALLTPHKVYFEGDPKAVEELANGTANLESLRPLNGRVYCATPAGLDLEPMASDSRD